jgi:hypothetical protein
MSSNSTLGCAVGNNGDLLDETHIDFFNDPDDLAPISGPSYRSATAKASTLDRYITRTGPTHTPAEMVAGSRRSTPIPHPSEKVKLAMDTNCPETVTAGAKRRAEASLQRTSAHCHFSKASTDQSDEDVNPTDKDVNPTDKDVNPTEAEADDSNESASKEEEEELEGNEAAYIHTKSLGDTDRSVSTFLFIF